MFCHSIQCPLYCSNFPDLKQSKQSSYIRCLWLSVVMTSVAIKPICRVSLCWVSWHPMQTAADEMYWKQIQQHFYIRTGASIVDKQTSLSVLSVIVCWPQKVADIQSSLKPVNTKRGSITVPLTSCLTGLD